MSATANAVGLSLRTKDAELQVAIVLPFLSQLIALSKNFSTWIERVRRKTRLATSRRRLKRIRSLRIRVVVWVG
jgi:hypothetical protein